jgi:putative glutamine amidotransferase
VRPLIGLSTYREQARWGVWDQPADLLPTRYADSIQRAGGVPVLLPPIEPAAATYAVGRLDGLVIAGGADAWELALLEAAEGRELPVLGICRGMQVMAVHSGGTLDQHLPDSVGHQTHSPSGPEFGDVDIETVPGTRLRMLLGDRSSVGCHHHQSVREHPGFIVAARAEDGTVEAIEAPGERFRLAVQWHPETRADAGLFAGLVAAATSYAA